jgi:hypothetical protein
VSVAAVASRGGRARRVGTAGPRAGLVLLSAVQAEIGIWGELSPRSLYTSFPGGGHRWVAALGPYNEHLIRDYAAAELGLAVLLACAAVWFERRVVLAAGVAVLVATVPHLAYHLTTTGSFSTTDNLLSLGGFALELALVAGAMVVVLRPDPNPKRSDDGPVETR